MITILFITQTRPETANLILHHNATKTDNKLIGKRIINQWIFWKLVLSRTERKTQRICPFVEHLFRFRARACKKIKTFNGSERAREGQRRANYLDSVSSFFGVTWTIKMKNYNKYSHRNYFINKTLTICVPIQSNLVAVAYLTICCWLLIFFYYYFLALRLRSVWPLCCVGFLIYVFLYRSLALSLSISVLLVLLL